MFSCWIGLLKEIREAVWSAAGHLLVAVFCWPSLARSKCQGDNIALGRFTSGPGAWAAMQKHSLSRNAMLPLSWWEGNVHWVLLSCSRSTQILHWFCTFLFTFGCNPFSLLPSLALPTRIAARALCNSLHIAANSWIGRISGEGTKHS